MIRVRNFKITKRYKQRLAGLLNFAIPILRLPFQLSTWHSIIIINYISLLTLFTHMTCLTKHLSIIRQFIQMPLHHRQALLALTTISQLHINVTSPFGIRIRGYLDSSCHQTIRSNLYRQYGLSPLVPKGALSPSRETKL